LHFSLLYFWKIFDTRPKKKPQHMRDACVCVYTYGKLQITPIKFEGVWILPPEVSEFGFYP